MPTYQNGNLPGRVLLDVGGGHRLHVSAAHAWQTMVAAAAADGVNLTISSGYRTAAQQQAAVDQHGLYPQPGGGGAAPAGFSNHGFGAAIDVGGIGSSSSAAFQWLSANGATYGFNAPMGDEPWHWEYVGYASPIGDPNYVRADGSTASRPRSAATGVNPPGSDNADPPEGLENDTGVNQEEEGELDLDWAPPPGGTLMRTRSGGGFVLRWEVSPGVYVEYNVKDTFENREGMRRGGYRPRRDAEDYFRVPEGSQVLGYRDTGHMRELTGMLEAAGVDTIEEWWEDTFISAFGYNSDAAQDPEVQKIIFEIFQNPDISGARIQNMLERTEYYQSRNQRQNEWADLSRGEQAERIADEARGLALDHRKIVGLVNGSPVATSDPFIQFYAEKIASGEMTRGQVLDIMEDAALTDPESPYSRTQRAEDIESRQFGVDIENTAGELEGYATAYGVQLADDGYTEWATNIVMNNASQQDYEDMIEAQAATMYPNRPAGMRTIDWAQPWINTLMRTLEVGVPNLNDPRLAGALQSGVTPFDFQRQLMNDPAWLMTENAADTLVGAFGEAAQMMGFA